MSRCQVFTCDDCGKEWDDSKQPRGGCWVETSVGHVDLCTTCLARELASLVADLDGRKAKEWYRSHGGLAY